MTDRELLEKAAKAAGYFEFWSDSKSNDVMVRIDGKKWMLWNPLADDGDALRLAVKLNLWIDIMDDRTQVTTSNCGTDWDEIVMHDDDPLAATRRAIVRAAAEIGEQK